MSLIVEVLEGLCMGGPMNSGCAHSMKSEGFLARSNFHLTSKLPVAADLEDPGGVAGEVRRGSETGEGGAEDEVGRLVGNSLEEVDEVGFRGPDDVDGDEDGLEGPR